MHLTLNEHDDDDDDVILKVVSLRIGVANNSANCFRTFRNE